MGNGYRIGFFWVVNKIILGVVICIFVNDFDGVFIGFYCIVGIEIVENCLDDRICFCGKIGVIVDVGVV